MLGDARPGDEDAVAFGCATADAAAKLVQLREAEALGMFDHHDGGVGNVDADFDDGGGDQHVDLAALEAAHDDFLLVGVEAAMQQADAQARQADRCAVSRASRQQTSAPLLCFSELAFWPEMPGKRSAVLPLRDVFAGCELRAQQCAADGSSCEKSSSGWSSLLPSMTG